MKKIHKICLIFSFITFVLLFSTAGDMFATTLENNVTGPNPESYWIKNQGYVDQIIYKVITNDDLLIQAVRTGEIDIIGQFVDVSLLLPADFNDPNLGLTQTRRRGFGQITFNSQKFPVSVRAMRQGFAYALDKVDLQQRALGGASYTADSPIIGSLGVWSCEYEFTLSPCSPKGERYYDPQVTTANNTILNAGFYDYDGDGFREYFDGNVTHTSLGLIWNGVSVAQGNVLGTTSGYSDPNWNGYTYLGEDGVRRTFPEVNVVMGGAALSPDSSGAANLGTGMDADWEEVSFTVTGSAGSNIVTSVTTMTSEAFYSMGIEANTEFITFALMLSKMASGDFFSAFFAYSNLSPDPTFLQTFYGQGFTNIDRTRWYNESFDALWEIIDTSSVFDDVLNANFQAQQILWQEQPLVVMYNNELTSLFRTDKFEGFTTIPGVGAFNEWSILKTHLKNTDANRAAYPNYPLGGTFVYGMPQPMDSQNTMVSNNPYTIQVMNTLEDKLFTRNPEDLTYIASKLASSWIIETPYTDSVADQTAYPNAKIIDGSKFTFNLLDNVTWHDGSAFTSRDVKFSFEAIKTNVSPAYYDLLTNIPPERIETPNNYSVIIYSNSSGLFEFGNLMIPIYQESYWNQFSDLVNHGNPIPRGTGAYKWVSSTAGEFYLLERYQNHYRTPIDDLGIPTTAPSTTTATSSGIPTSTTTISTSTIITTTPTSTSAPPPISKPDPPRLLTTSLKNGIVQLNWFAPSSLQSPPITAYYIYKSIGSGVFSLVSTIDLAITQELSYEDNITGIEGVLHYYVTAISADGESDLSNIASVAIQQAGTTTTIDILTISNNSSKPNEITTSPFRFELHLLIPVVGVYLVFKKRKGEK